MLCVLMCAQGLYVLCVLMCAWEEEGLYVLYVLMCAQEEEGLYVLYVLMCCSVLIFCTVLCTVLMCCNVLLLVCAWEDQSENQFSISHKTLRVLYSKYSTVVSSYFNNCLQQLQ